MQERRGVSMYTTWTWTLPNVCMVAAVLVWLVLVVYMMCDLYCCARRRRRSTPRDSEVYAAGLYGALGPPNKVVSDQMYSSR